MRKLESLADALALLNDYRSPESESYRLRNPGMLKAKTLEALGDSTDTCIRIFTCHQGGYKALIDTLRKQCQRCGHVTLRANFAFYGHANDYEVDTAVDFIKRALDDRTVSSETTLDFFLTE
jgi:hypothetical protein